MISWMGGYITLVLSMKNCGCCFNVIGLSFKMVSARLSAAKMTQTLHKLCVCSDVDDPEYKPAPALLKDEMEVRPHQPKLHVGLLIKYIKKYIPIMKPYIRGLSCHKYVFSRRMTPLPLETWLSLTTLEVSIRGL